MIFKIVFTSAAALSLAIAPSSADADEGDLQRLAALVDYVAADYPGAVRDGRVVAQTEYDEQRGLVRDAAALARALPAPDAASRDALLADLAAVERAVDGKQSPGAVLAACRAARARLVDRFGLTLAPSAPPSAERARNLYRDAC